MRAPMLMPWWIARAVKLSVAPVIFSLNVQFVTETDIAIVEFVPPPLFPGGGVQMVIDGTDYAEEAVSATSEEGLALLRDAGVDC